MRITATTTAVLVFAALIGCRQQPKDNRTQMMLDSDVSGKDVTVVRPTEAVRPTESFADLSTLSTIMAYDIDAAKRTPSAEIVYVKPGEAVAPVEKKPGDSREKGKR